MTEPDEPRPAAEDAAGPDDRIPAPAEADAPETPAAEPEPAAPSGRIRRDGTRLLAVPAARLRRQTRRDFFLFGAGAAAAAAAFYGLLPDDTRSHYLTEGHREFLDSLEGRLGLSAKRRENLLNRALTFDDDVAEAIYSPRRLVRTYRRSDRTPVPNNYAGETPDPDYIPDWQLEVEGLASGTKETFAIGDLLSGFRHHEQVTRLCCVEGWSAIGWWGGLRFADFLEAHPPAAGAKWAKLESAVNLDSDGEPDPYFVSIDLPTARHPQTLLATHRDGRPLSVEHGAPLRLLAPMKLGLKNIKAITRIVYSSAEPPDYWNLQGYSKYDGI
ncbi:MAG TPA: molybdopterin-dependent oxidoreductase [Thermoanaerobaculia bacterium]|nr:molybdopterin-dependent oxidoreductase [Thermoanaerobaculia bacterium]